MKRLSMFLLGTVFIGLVAFATPHNELPGYASFNAVKVYGYESLPMNVVAGETLIVEATFQAPYDMYSATVKCDFTIGNFGRGHLLEENAQLANGFFPIEAGQEVTAYIKIPILITLPRGIPMRLEIMINDVLYTPVVGTILDFIIKL